MLASSTREKNTSNTVLERLAIDAFDSIDSGYYEVSKYHHKGTDMRRSLCEAIKKGKRDDNRASLVCEIKFASPSAGNIRSCERDRDQEVSEIAVQMKNGGAIALSVLTEKRNFNGSISDLISARKAVDLPVIMKDIIVSPKQIESASKLGADAILLIYELFEKNLTRGLSIVDAINLAHKFHLETIVETCSKQGLSKLLRIRGMIDVIGINNRDLKTFKVSTNKTIRLLSTFSDDLCKQKRSFIVLSESGFKKPADITRVLEKTFPYDPDAFLIGTSIMSSKDIQSKVRDFASSLSGERNHIA
jgi:indole-3-glycerol phosphate synthase